jgi:hypothetical protein
VTENELKKVGAMTLYDKLECMCRQLEKVQDVVTVCAMALEGPEPASPSISKVLHDAAVRPLGLSLSQLSEIILRLRGEAEAE